MICLYAHSRLCMAAIVFFTCILIPLREIKSKLLGIISFLIFGKHNYPDDDNCSNMVFLSLPVSRYEDLQCYGGCKGEAKVDETCSICLLEYENEDLVSQLHRCGHAFHMNCIEKWLERNHFTCPLCRSFIFNVNPCDDVKCALQ